MNQLPESNTLMVIAQIAATFVGFSTVYFVFDKDRMNVQRRHFLRTIADTGLAALFGCFLPLFVADIIGDIEVAWRVSAGLFAVIWGGGWLTDSMKYWKAGVSASFTGTVYSPDNILNAVGISLLGWTVFVGPPNAGTLYTLAMMLVLAVSAGCFVAGAFVGQRETD